jgi:hypothetical protein
MLQLCYVSSATRLMGRADLTELLEASRGNNDSRQIGGMLLYKDLSFLQVLEGREDVVLEVFSIIREDPRHTNVRILFQEQVEQAEFPSWSMGFQNLDKADLSDLEGYTDVMDSGDSAKHLFDDATRAKRLLLLFRARS